MVKNELEDIKQLIAKGKTDKALSDLLLLFKREGWEEPYQTGTLISARFYEWSQKETMGLEPPQKDLREIQFSLLQLINHVERNNLTDNKELSEDPKNIKEISIQSRGLIIGGGIVIILGLVFSFLGYSVFQNKKNYKSAMEKAQKSFDSGDYDQTIVFCDTALGIYPNDTKSQNLREESKQKLQQIVRIRRNEAKADSLLDKQKFNDALQIYQELLGFDSVADIQYQAKIKLINQKLSGRKSSASTNSGTSTNSNTSSPSKGKQKNLILVRGGSFSMGNPGSNAQNDDNPAHIVNLSTFYISQYEITNREYCDFLNAKNISSDEISRYINLSGNGCRIQNHGDGYEPHPGFENYPVVQVRWDGAQSYCRWVGGRLPTEAEWEYAAKAGESFNYAGSYNLSEVGWYSGNTRELQPIGRKRSNTLRLYDMSGNVAEWCQDYYDYSYYETTQDLTDPRGPRTGSTRVIRGGNWKEGDAYCQVFYRSSGGLYMTSDNIGFRVVR